MPYILLFVGGHREVIFNKANGIVVASSISNGNRTEWSPRRSFIIQVITKSDDRAAGVRFVYRKYDYRSHWTTRSLITN